MGDIKSTSIRLDADVKEQATRVFDSLGMSFSTGIEVYLRAVVRRSGIPFDLTLSQDNERSE